MPICRTCRGEYSQQEALCPKCGAPVGRSVDLCHHCGADTSERRLCPRCKSDVSAWEREDISFVDFIIWEGGILALLPGAAALFVWLFFWTPRVNSMYFYPVLTAATFIISAFTVFVLYVKRLFWWERWLASQVYRATPASIVLMIVLSGSAGVFLSALWVFLYAAWGKPELLALKAIFGAVYVSSYVFLTVATTLMIIHTYISRIGHYVPQPIFMDTKRLLMVVVESVIATVNLTAMNTPEYPSSSGLKPVYDVLEALRIPENGGIDVLLRECKRVRHATANGQVRAEWTEMLWRIRADRWGRVQTIQPGPKEPEAGGARTFREYGRFS